VVKSPIVGSPDEKLDVPFNALALDGADIPTTIYVGTDFGVLRSMDIGQSAAPLLAHFRILFVAKIKIFDRITYSIGLQSSGAYAIRQRRNAVGKETHP
jgi:hypothetical protein